MLCQICTIVQKSIVTAKDDERRGKFIKAYAEHLRRDHHLAPHEIEARMPTSPAALGSEVGI